MKRLCLLAAVLIITIPLVAAEEKKSEGATEKQLAAKPASAKKGSTPKPAIAPPSPAENSKVKTPAAPLAAPAGMDSPLVAAAKRTNAARKTSAIVISNETVAKSGANAHITTTTIQTPIPAIPADVAPPAAPPAKSAVFVPSAKTTNEQADKEKQEKLKRAMAEAEEEGPYGDDPAQAEAIAAEAAKSSQQTPPSKPPQP